MVVHFGQRILKPEVTAHEGRRLVQQFAQWQLGVQQFGQVGNDRLAGVFNKLTVLCWQVAWQGKHLGRILQTTCFGILFAQRCQHFFKCRPVRQGSTLARARQQRGADDCFGIFAGIFKLGGVCIQLFGHPDGCIDELGGVAAAR